MIIQRSNNYFKGLIITILNYKLFLFFFLKSNYKLEDSNLV